MSDKTKALIVILVTLAAAFSFLGVIGTRDAERREAECETLKKIGAHRGESIMVFGDVPTWKLECLFDNGGD